MALLKFNHFVYLFLISTALISIIQANGNGGFSVWARYLDEIRVRDREQYYKELDRLFKEQPQIYHRYLEPLTPNFMGPSSLHDPKTHIRRGDGPEPEWRMPVFERERAPLEALRNSGNSPMEMRLERLAMNLNDRMDNLEDKIQWLTRHMKHRTAWD